MKDFTGTTDDEGRAAFTVAAAGLYSIRARHIIRSGSQLRAWTFD